MLVSEVCFFCKKIAKVVHVEAQKKTPRDCSLRATLKFIGWQSIDN